MKQDAISVILGYDPSLAGNGFTVNGAASFDLASAIALACDLLRHQGAPVPQDVTLQSALAAPELLSRLVELLSCVDERCGGRAEGNSRLVAACEKARATIAKTGGRS